MEFAKKLDTYGMSIRDIYGSVHFERYELTKREAHSFYKMMYYTLR